MRTQPSRWRYPAGPAGRRERPGFRGVLWAAVVSMALVAPSLAVDAPRDITWDDLIPTAAPLEDPFPNLNSDQRFEVEILTALRELHERGVVSEDEPEYEDIVEITRKLKDEGLDVDALVAEQVKLNAKINQRNEAVVGDLDGQLIRMPGYALPLEFIETGVKEFLLVPFVGACIHVPPPPPNQMVFVRVDQTFKADDLYTPVWVTGRMTVKRTSQALSLVDGQADVATGYVLDGIKVDPYEE